jgi:hypothetical protein
MIDHDCFADHLESITVGVELNFAAIFDQAQNLSIYRSIDRSIYLSIYLSGTLSARASHAFVGMWQAQTRNGKKGFRQKTRIHLQHDPHDLQYL